jgi:protein SCO1/2
VSIRNRRLLQVSVGALAGVAIASGLAWWTIEPPPAVIRLTEAATAGPQVGGPFRLTDHTGRAVTDADFGGRFMLIYFGYTYCPDICPTEMQTFAEVMDRLGPLADRVQPILITVDPARDTAEHLAGYVALFHPRLVGLTGTDAQIAEVARAYRVYYAKTDAKDGGAYLMDHSAAVYLMGPDGRFATIFGRGVPADRMAEQIRARIPAG